MRDVITKDTIRKLPAGPCEIWDAKLNGLVLRVRTSGTATWVFRYGQSKKVTLGRADAIPPALARSLAQGVIGEMAAGKDPQAERRKRQAGTLAQFLDTHPDLNPDTVTRVRAIFPEFLPKPMTELSPFLFERWRSARRKTGHQQQGVTDTTINRDFNAIRAVLSKAVEWNILREHPMRTVKAAKIDTVGRLRYLSVDEEQRLRQALILRDDARRDGRRRFNAWRADRGYVTFPELGTYVDHLHPIVLLALNTGLRRGELFALTWADVDLVAARLVVRGATAKSGLTRHVPLNSEAVTVLKTWRACVPDATVVFPGPQGEPMTTLKTAWMKVAKAAALQDFTFHDLRHSFASKLVMAGVDLNTVRELLGHSDLKMTLRYAHLAPSATAAAVAKLVSA